MCNLAVVWCEGRERERERGGGEGEGGRERRKREKFPCGLCLGGGELSPYMT